MNQEPGTSAKDTGRVTKALDSLPTLPIVALRIGEVDPLQERQRPAGRRDPARPIRRRRRSCCGSSTRRTSGSPAASPTSRARSRSSASTRSTSSCSASRCSRRWTRTAGHSTRKQLWLHSLTVGDRRARARHGAAVRRSGRVLHRRPPPRHGQDRAREARARKGRQVFASMRDEGLTMHEAEAKHDLAGRTTGSAAGSLGSGSSRRRSRRRSSSTTRSTSPSIRERLAPNLRSITEIVVRGRLHLAALHRKLHRRRYDRRRRRRHRRAAGPRAQWLLGRAARVVVRQDEGLAREEQSLPLAAEVACFLRSRRRVLRSCPADPARPTDPASPPRRLSACGPRRIG